ncbi:MAG: hypothetical protein AAF389_19445 [Gemmatimonadota bacterium]
MKAILDGLTHNQAFTSPEADDPRLRGRTYAIPFETVWQGSVGLGGGGLHGWSIESADDQQGIIQAAVRARLLAPEVVVRIDIGLDENAQTRVDLSATARTERGDFGRSRRLVRSFLERLDRKLGADPSQILEPQSPHLGQKWS